MPPRRIALLLLVSLIAALGRPAGAEALYIIANPLVPVETVSLTDVSAIYLLKTTSWPDGNRIIPVNREAASNVRVQFNSQVLKQDNASLSTYWNEMHFKGRVPPLIQESDQAVLAFVQKIPGAIGYVAGPAPPAAVKILGRIP